MSNDSYDIKNGTYVNLADLGVYRSVWTSAFAHIDPIVVSELFKNAKINGVGEKIPLYKCGKIFVFKVKKRGA